MDAAATKLCGLLLLLGCSSGGNLVLDPIHEIGLLENQSLTVANEARNYHLYLPQNPANAPIIFIFHGNGGSGDQILGLMGTKSPYKVWLDIALRENVILVVPDGSFGTNNKQGWNDCRVDAQTNPESDDVLFVSNVLNHVENEYGTGTAPVYTVGTSNGGLMVMRLADEMPQKFKGIAVVVASRPENTECVGSSDPISVLLMNGTDDPILPYGGGRIGFNRGDVLSTKDTVDYWINRNRTDLIPLESAIPDIDQNDNSTIKRFSYTNGVGGTKVEHYEIVDGGHTEPSIQERYGNLFKLIVGNQNGDLEMAEEIWKFFNSL